MISGDERQRYDCQLVLKEVGERGQEKLRDAAVLVVGAGGLGAPVLYYLAAAGVGRLGIVDDDVVELSNLQRQILFTHRRHRPAPRRRAAAERLRALNPEVDAASRTRSRLRAANASTLIDALRRRRHRRRQLPDALPAQRRLRAARKTLVDGAVLRMIGLAMTIKGGETACYRCLFPEPPPPAGVVSCSEAGVLGPIPGTHRRHPGARGHQGPHRRRAAALRPPAAVRRRRDDLQRGRGRAGPVVPGVRRDARR